MIFAVLVLAAVGLCVFADWILRGEVLGVSDETSWSNLREVDLDAVRNLLSKEDEEFLRSSLQSANYRQVRRARVKALQEYMTWIAGNCSVLFCLLRKGTAEVEAVADAERLGPMVRTAARLRLFSLTIWLALWVEYALPRLQIRPYGILSKYEEFRLRAEFKLRPCAVRFV